MEVLGGDFCNRLSCKIIMNYSTILGLAAGLFTTVSFLPQVIKSWRSHRTTDISLVTFLILSIGSLLWLLYGIIKIDMPIIVANAITLVFELIIIVLKIKYK